MVVVLAELDLGSTAFQATVVHLGLLQNLVQLSPRVGAFGMAVVEVAALALSELMVQTLAVKVDLEAPEVRACKVLLPMEMNSLVQVEEAEELLRITTLLQLKLMASADQEDRP